MFGSKVCSRTRRKILVCFGRKRYMKTRQLENRRDASKHKNILRNIRFYLLQIISFWDIKNEISMEMKAESLFENSSTGCELDENMYSLKE